jgi:hypothetical protein
MHRRWKWRAAQAAVVVVMGVALAACPGPSQRHVWEFNGHGYSRWEQWNVAHNLHFAQAHDSDCLQSWDSGDRDHPFCSQVDYGLLGSRLIHSHTGAVYGPEVHGYPRAGRHYAGDTGTYHQVQGGGPCGACRYTAVEEW